MFLNNKIDEFAKLVQERYHKETILVDKINEEINNYQDKIKMIDDDVEVYKKTILVLTESSRIARQQAKDSFEKIVTEALQFVTQSTDYEFIIQENQDSSKPAYEFYIKTTVNGEESLQKPQDANGGGFIDIISVAAKYAYLELFNDPPIMNSTIILDEPGKMIDEDRSIKFAEYIKELGTIYGKQTIMITHNKNLSDIADETFNVSKDDANISRISTTTPGLMNNQQLVDWFKQQIWITGNNIDFGGNDSNGSS